MQWSIPQPSDPPLAIELEAGEQIFVVGPNGSGKSALLQHLAASSGGGKIRRIFAHRQTWLNSGSLTLTPESRRQFERDRSGRETANDAIWRDRWGADTHAAVLFDLVAAENKRARSIAGHVENSEINRAKKVANAASPFTRLNDLLRAGTLRVSLHNPDDVEIVASKGFGPTFGIERMSDGERNAVIMAATVLTVDPDTTLFIDEPERHLHRAIIAPFLSALFEQRQDCAFVVSTHELFLPVENPSARVLMTRSCTWAEANPQAWDLEILAHPAELPEELRLAVLGARGRVLFVEGSSTSLDLPLYDNRPSLAAILDELRELTGRPVRAVLRAGSAGLTLLAAGPWLAWLPLDLLDRLPGLPLRALPLSFGRRPYRAGFVARRSAEDLEPFRALEAAVRDAALGRNP